MSGISEQQARSLAQQLTELGLCPGANTSRDCLCLVNDPLEGDFDCWWVAWDEALACWVVAHQHLAQDGSLIEQKAWRWVSDPATVNKYNGPYWSWSEAPFQGW